LVISDAARGSAAPFYWLQPTVPTAPLYVGPFDASLTNQLSIEICELAGNNCAMPLLTTLTSSGSPFSARIRMDPIREHYLAYWNTALNSVDPNKFYRATVKLNRTALGYIDVDVVPTRSQLGTVNTAQYVGVAVGAQVTLRFRIEVSMLIFAGSNDTATVGTPVAVPPSVIVRDVNNHPLSGVGVQFAVTSGGGKCCAGFTSQNAITDASGIATVSGWVLGPVPGPNTLTATSGVTGSPITFTAIGMPLGIDIKGGNNQFASVNRAVAVPPSVVVTDFRGNPVSGVGVQFVVTSGSGKCCAGFTSQNATTDASGIATVSDWVLGPVPGANTLTATSFGVVGSPITFTATGTPLTIAIYDGNNETVSVFGTIRPRVIVTDANGQPVNGYGVTFLPTPSVRIDPVSGNPFYLGVTGCAGFSSATALTGSQNAPGLTPPGVADGCPWGANWGSTAPCGGTFTLDVGIIYGPPTVAGVLGPIIPIDPWLAGLPIKFTGTFSGGRAGCSSAVQSQLDRSKGATINGGIDAAVPRTPHIP
jgi:hypothetical protein